MKKFKTLFIAFLLFFVTSNTIAQQATVSDFIGNWTGAGSNGESYIMTLNEDNSATLKAGSTAIDVVSWKLNFVAGNINYDINNHAVMRLITNVTTTASAPVSSQSLTSSGISGSDFKVYYTDVYYDMTSKSLTMIVDFQAPVASSGGSTAVTIVFSK